MMWLPPALPRKFAACERDLASEKEEVRASATADLARHTREAGTRARALELLATALRDGSPRVRAAAAVALADGEGAKEHVEALLAAVDDDDDEVRQLVISALGEIGDPSAVPRLLRAQIDTRPSMRYQAVIALARVAEDEETRVRALLRATSDEDMNVRYIALRLAEEYAADPAPERLRVRAVALLEDEEADVRVAAAIYLAHAADERAKPALRQIVRGELRAQREDEREAVELTGALAMHDLTSDLERRAFGLTRHFTDTSAYHALIALARMEHPRAIATITGDLSSRSRKRREAAVVAAGRAHLRGTRERIATLGDDAVAAPLRDEALRALEE